MPRKMYHGVMKKRREREAKMKEELRQSGVVMGKPVGKGKGKDRGKRASKLGQKAGNSKQPGSLFTPMKGGVLHLKKDMGSL